MKNINYYLVTFLKSLLFSACAFLTPIKGLLILVGTCVVFDTLFAIYVTIKKKGWASYQSDKLFNVVVKSFFYLGSIILAYMVDVHIIDDKSLFGINLIMAKFVSVFWVYVEFKSIDETSQKIGNKSFYFTIKKIIANLKALKKDINELRR